MLPSVVDPAPKRGSETATATFAAILVVIMLTAPEAYAGNWRAVEGWVVTGCPKSGGQCTEYGGLPSPRYGDCNSALTPALRASAPSTAFSCRYVRRQQFFQ